MTNEANSQTFFYAFDANGKATQLIDESGNLSAHYEYYPFGQLTTATGPMANDNLYRFSTKYQDQATGLLYYGFRYYDPEMGRWLSRDPIGEQGGLNVYRFVGNEPIGLSDILGLAVQFSFDPKSLVLSATGTAQGNIDDIILDEGVTPKLIITKGDECVTEDGCKGFKYIVGKFHYTIKLHGISYIAEVDLSAHIIKRKVTGSINLKFNASISAQFDNYVITDASCLKEPPAITAEAAKSQLKLLADTYNKTQELKNIANQYKETIKSENVTELIDRATDLADQIKNF